VYFVHFSPGFFAEDRVFTLSALSQDERHERHERVEKCNVHTLSL
jgi:hypothetical protein